MDDSVSNHQLLLSDNYIVQPFDSLPVSIIDCEKMEVSQLIHSGQLINGTPVIHLADVNSNVKLKVLHPLEVELQKEFDLKQMQDLKKEHSSVIQSSSQAKQEEIINRNSESLFNEGTQFQALNNEKDNILNVDSSKLLGKIFCHISSVNKEIPIEKGELILLSENPMSINIGSKENPMDLTKFHNSCSNLELVEKVETHNIPVTINNYEETKKNKKKEKSNIINSFNNITNVKISDRKSLSESNSENEEDEMEPVCDYEPDPETPVIRKEEQLAKPNKCYMCFKSFRQKKNMYAHIRNIHSIQPKIEGGILCPLCKMHALRQEHLRNHLMVLHKIPIEKEEKLFNTKEDFICWKEFIERETLSLYVSKSSPKLLANNQQKTYYKCHRSGNYVTRTNENRKKRLKAQGSNKIGATCPAAIEVTENTHGINVTFWKTHVGHNNDLAHLMLSKEDRTKIMDYIASGVSWDKILENIKKEESKNPNTPSRLTIISKQDIRNIKKIQEAKNTQGSLISKKKIAQGRKPVKERMLRRASQSMVIKKADRLLKLLEATDVKSEFRPKICLMIDNLISTIKRRAVKISKKGIQKRKQLCSSNSNFENSFKEEPQQKENKTSVIIPNMQLHLEENISNDNDIKHNFKEIDCITLSLKNSNEK